MTAKANQPVRQHFVPRSFLRNFCDADGQVHHCILRPQADHTIRPHWAKGSPETLGFEKNLYTLGDAEDDRYAIERQLADIDANGIQAIRDCLARRPDRISLASEPHLGLYIATLANRVPSALKFKMELEPYVRQGIIRGLPNNTGPRGIRHDTDYVAEQLARFTVFPEYYPATEGLHLLTSDRPVSLYSLGTAHDGRIEQPSPVSASLPDCWKDDVTCVLPISSHCVMFAIRGTKRLLKEIFNGYLQVGTRDKRFAWANAMTAFDANHLYARSTQLQFLLPHDPQAYHADRQNNLGNLEQFLMAVEKANAATTIRLRKSDT